MTLVANLSMASIFLLMVLDNDNCVIMIDDMRIKFYILALIFLTFTAAAQAIDRDQLVIICPVQSADEVIPSFNGPDCEKTTIVNINPQNQHIWVKTQLKINPQLLKQPQPLGLYIVGKTSSIVYVNGELIGSNGMPASTVHDEIEGKMDVVFYIDKSIIKNQNDNQLVIRMSAQKSVLNLSHPINAIYVSVYSNPTQMILNHYWFSILPFGAFVLAALYLGVLSLRQKNTTIVFLSLMSFFAACQLMVEITRGIQSYLYPFHDIRLILIVFFSYAFGLSLFSHIAYRFVHKKQLLLISAVMTINIVCVLLVDAYDLKAAVAVILPASMSMLICLYFAFKKTTHALLFSVALMVFIILFVISPSIFLDRYFYYVVASLLVFLFIQQATDLSNQSKINKIEKARADQLQLIIDQNNEKANPTQLKIKGAGQLTLVALDDIAFCKGAGDYVEIFKTDEKSTLYNGTLKELEISLPAIFLKVHRSYIVNTTKIVSLDRNTAGTGELGLDNGAFIPVSRRIMPKVRESLA